MLRNNKKIILSFSLVLMFIIMMTTVQVVAWEAPGMPPNKILERFAKDEAAWGALTQFGTPETVELAGWAGYDWIWIDAEHGAFGIDRVISCIRAAESSGITPIIRIPSNTRDFVQVCLDAGAYGIIFPMINTKEDAQNAVDLAKYPPVGKRGTCPGIRVAQRMASYNDYVEWTKENILVWALIETVDACENIDEILAVEGLDGILLGPYDLSVDYLGEGANPNHPEVQEMLRIVAEKTKAAGKQLIGVQSTQEWFDRGVRAFSGGGDSPYSGWKSKIEELRKMFK